MFVIEKEKHAVDWYFEFWVDMKICFSAINLAVSQIFAKFVNDKVLIIFDYYFCSLYTFDKEYSLRVISNSLMKSKDW